MNNIFNAGGVSGAITDPNSKEALKHATMYYEEIRHMSNDVAKIAENTGFSEAQIMLVKNYLFTSKHILYDGIRQFDPCFEIAESWRRLAYDKKNIQPHDIILLKHELKEMSLVAQGVPQEDAHKIATDEYDYCTGYEEYYKSLGLKVKKIEEPKVSGAITRKSSVSKKAKYEYSRW